MPFGDYAVNPVQHIAEHFNGKIIGQYGKRKVIGMVLPCGYFSAFHILSQAIDEIKPTAIISMGLSSSVKGIRIETRFRNKMHSKYADCDGYKPVHTRIKQIARGYYEATADAQLLASTLSKNNISNEISTNADSFICNSLGYLTTRKIVISNLHITNTLIHIPWTDEYKDQIVLSPKKLYMKKEEVYEAFNLLLDTI